MKKIALLFSTSFLLSQISLSQNVGIANTNPQAKLDVNGDMILRSFSLVLSNGTQIALDVNSNKFSNYKLTGPTSSFVIAGITAAVNDRVISLYNRTGQSMQLNNDDPIVMLGNKIFTGTGAPFVVYSGGAVTLRYDGTNQHWEIISSHYNNLDYFGGGSGTSYWDISGINIHNNNIGNVGIGVTAPITKLHIAEGANVLFGADTTGPALGFQNVQRKVYWSAAKGSLHVGGLSGFGGRGNWWSDSLTGNYAFSAGSSNLTSGDYSSAIGVVNRATGTGSIAIGNNNISSGNYGIALGASATALGQQSIAIGLGATATRDKEIKIGALDMPGNGKVGVNTLDPKSFLEINSLLDSAAFSISNSGTQFNVSIRKGNADAPNDTTLYFKTPSASNSSFRFDNAIFKNGNLGIGTGNPQSAIHLKGTLQQLRIEGDENAIDFYNSTGYSGSIAPNTKYVSSNIEPALVLQSAASYPIVFYTLGSQERMRITGSGGVGIGTNDPGNFKLDVNGVVRGSSVAIGAASASSPLTFANIVGKKISFYNSGPNNDFGIGIQSGEMQLYTAGQDMISFGYGSSGSYTRTMTYYPGSAQLAINCLAQPGYSLAVKGHIRATEIRVNTNWADYVFDDAYTLKPLEDVELFIKKHKHLPGITDAATLEAEGMDVSKMQSAMMGKIEELTLYMIEANKRIEKLEKENAAIKHNLNN